MPIINIEITHGLGQDLALQRLKDFSISAEKNYKSEISDLKINWTGNPKHFNLKVRNISISGNLIVKDRNVLIESKIPLALVVFKSQIKKMITEYGMKILSK